MTDFIKQDVSRLYSDLLPYVNITLVEAGPALLGPFDAALQNYAHGLFKKRDIDVRLGTAVTGVNDAEIEGYHFPSRQVCNMWEFRWKRSPKTSVYALTINELRFTRLCSMMVMMPAVTKMSIAKMVSLLPRDMTCTKRDGCCTQQFDGLV